MRVDLSGRVRCAANVNGQRYEELQLSVVTLLIVQKNIMIFSTVHGIWY